jgi:hypothetical protein
MSSILYFLAPILIIGIALSSAYIGYILIVFLGIIVDNIDHMPEQRRVDQTKSVGLLTFDADNDDIKNVDDNCPSTYNPYKDDFNWMALETVVTGKPDRQTVQNNV